MARIVSSSMPDDRIDTPPVTKASDPPQEGRRPILVWVLYAAHLLLIPWLIWYVAAVFRLVPVDDYMSAALAQHSWQTKLSSVIVVSLLVAGAHRLFFRHPRVLLIYLIAPGFYTFQNVLIFGKYCLHRSCPPLAFFGPVVINVLIMLGAAFLIAVALRRWPPLDRRLREA